MIQHRRVSRWFIAYMVTSLALVAALGWVLIAR